MTRPAHLLGVAGAVHDGLVLVTVMRASRAGRTGVLSLGRPPGDDGATGWNGDVATWRGGHQPGALTATDLSATDLIDDQGGRACPRRSLSDDRGNADATFEQREVALPLLILG